jgi:hypothetical protein
MLPIRLINQLCRAYTADKLLFSLDCIDVAVGTLFGALYHMLTVHAILYTYWTDHRGHNSNYANISGWNSLGISTSCMKLTSELYYIRVYWCSIVPHDTFGIYYIRSTTSSPATVSWILNLNKMHKLSATGTDKLSIPPQAHYMERGRIAYWFMWIV